MSAVWGSSYFWTALALTSVSAPALVALRLLLGALVLGILVLAQRPGLTMPLRRYAAAAGLSILNICVPYNLLTWGQKYISSGLAALLSSTTPLFVFIIAAMMVRSETFSWRKLCFTVVAFTGVLSLVIGEAPVGGGNSTWGAIAALVSSAIFACGNVVTQRHFRDWSSKELAFTQLGFGGLFQVLFVLVFAGGLPEFDVAGAAILPIVWLGVLSSGACYFAFFYLIQHFGSSRASINTYLQPIVGLLLGAVFLGEAITAGMWLGIAVTAAGVVGFAAASAGSAPRRAPWRGG